jgi:hypothetical protein
LVRPSLCINWFSNPWLPDSAWNRIQMRWLGVITCLFVVMVLTGISTEVLKSEFAESFYSNIVAILLLGFFASWIVGILSWILWRFSAFRGFARARYLDVEIGDQAWERRMTVFFCLLLLFMIMGALFLAGLGVHA